MEQQVLQTSRGAEISLKLKTPQRVRGIPLAKGMLEQLEGDTVWVCSNSDGGHLLPRSVAKELKAACQVAGIPYVSPHDLRHTFISIMECELECPETIRREIVGHAAKTVHARYSHSRMDQKRKWMEKYWEHVYTDLRTIGCPQGAENLG